MANRAFPNYGRAYENLPMPFDLSCQFTVDNSVGAGISGLKSNGYIKSVFMHTTTTPASGSPNPAAGFVLIQLADNYPALRGMSARIQSPTTGSALNVHTSATLTVGNPYQITSLGTTTTAEWQSIGLPAGLTPAVGQSFIATAATTGGSNTGQVKALGVSGVNSFEFIGNADTMMGPQGVANQGGYILIQCMGPTSSSVTTPVPTAPANGSVINMTFKINNLGSVTVDGL